jgi:hypothetical protein
VTNGQNALSGKHGCFCGLPSFPSFLHARTFADDEREFYISLSPVAVVVPGGKVETPG